MVTRYSNFPFRKKRKFDGEIYTYRTDQDSKKAVKKSKLRYKRLGYKVRVIKGKYLNGETQYRIFVRKS